MCNNLQDPRKMQMALSGATAPRLRTIGLTSEYLQKIKLILSENVVEPRIYTALLSTFSSQSKKNGGVKYVYQKYQVRNKKKMPFKWCFRSFV